MQALTGPGPSSGASTGPSLRIPLWLFVSLASVWGAIVLSAHFRILPVPWSVAVDDAAQALSAARGLGAELAREHLAVLSCVFVILVAAMAVGRGLLSLLGVGALPAGERLLFSVTLGFGTLSYVMLGLVALGWLSTTGAWALVGTLAAAGVLQALRGASPRKGRPGVGGRLRLTLLDRLAIGALSLQAGITLIGALAPLIFYDSLAYHLAAPHLSMLNRRLMPMPENLLAQMPAAAGYLSALAIILKNEIAAKVLCWLCGIGVAAAICLFARRMSWRGAGLWGVLIFLTLFHVSQASTAGGIDLALTLFSVCSAYAFLAWMEAGQQQAPRSGAFPLLVLSAVFSGFAMATKYTGALVPASLIATLFISRWRKGSEAGRCLKASLWLALIASLVFSPWLVRNTVLYGNPVAPFLPGIFAGSNGLQLASMHAFRAEAAQHHLVSLRDYLSFPWKVTMGSIENSAVFSPLFLFLCPLLLLFKSFPRSLRWAALFTGLFATGWILTSTAVRYLMPVLPWACLLLAYWATHARLGRPLRIAVRSSILACCVTGILMSWVVTFRQGGWRVVFGTQDRQDYLSHSQDGYPNPPDRLYRWIDAELPATARILLLGETRGFHLNRDFVASSVFDKNPLLLWAETSTSADALAETLRKQGITHLLLNPGEARRLRSYGILETTEDGKRTLQEFWRHSVRQVAGFDELAGDQITNRVTLHAISSLDTEGSELPRYMARLLETP